MYVCVCVLYLYIFRFRTIAKGGKLHVARQLCSSPPFEFYFRRLLLYMTRILLTHFFGSSNFHTAPRDNIIMDMMMKFKFMLICVCLVGSLPPQFVKKKICERTGNGIKRKIFLFCLPAFCN